MPDATFQATFRVLPDVEKYNFEVGFQTSSEELADLVKAQRAVFCMHMECNSTFYRRIFTSQKPDLAVSESASRLRGKVEVNFFICAKQRIEAYSPRGKHEDYGDAKFDLDTGDVLAFITGYSFFAEREDVLKKVSSIMTVQPGVEGSRHLEVAFGGNKIVIFLPPEDFEMFGQVRNERRNASIIICALVSPVLIEALSLIDREEDSEDSEYSTCRWFQILSARRDKLTDELNIAKDEYSTIASALLDNPFKKALRELSGLNEVVTED